MATTGSSPLLHFGFLRIFGIFPIRMPADGMPTSHPSIPLMLLSISLGLSYIIAMSDQILYSLEKDQLSRALTALPYALTAVLTEFLMRTSSFRFRNQLFNFFALTNQSSNSLNSGDEGFLKRFWIAPALYSACSLVNLIGNGVVYETGVSYTNLKSGSDWDRLLAFWIILNDFLHDFTIISSLCFVVHAGKRAILLFELLCEEILKVCQPAVRNCSSSSIAQIQNGSEAWAPPGGTSNTAERLINMFADVKVAVGIYSKVGGTFIFALVLDQGVGIFYLACTALFGHPIAGVPFYYVMLSIYCLASIISLCTIAELGHQMASKVALQQEILADVAMRLQAGGREKQVKDVALSVVAWRWELKAVSFFTVNRSLAFKVFTVILSYIIFVFQLKISNL